MLVPGSRPPFITEAAKTAVATGVNAGFGYLGAHLVSSLALTPVVGAVVGGVSYLVSKCVDPLFYALFGRNHNAFVDFAGHVLCSATAITGSAFAASALGYTIAFPAAAALTAATIAVRIFAEIACAPCLVASKL